jgi:cellulose synthase/poly-beta-1,6-N-acetylglucosamine synthase-like glycosyltransferase
MSPILAVEILVAAAAPMLLGAVYVARLGAGARRRPKPAQARDPVSWPRVDVVVPVRDEADYIPAKIANLRALDYPPELLAFWIVDGNSNDGTPGLAAAAAGGDPRFSILDAGRADKIAQLNCALRRCRAEWVLVTDADARFGQGALKALVREAGRGTPAGAVGSAVVPARSHPWEALHWRIADRLRLAEAASGSASIVTGPCYLMRRDLLPLFPEDVVADDVHAAFRCAAAGLRTGFVDAGVVELRSPISIAELVRHKYRKGHAFVGEVLRYLPKAASFPLRPGKCFSGAPSRCSWRRSPSAWRRRLQPRSPSRSAEPARRPPRRRGRSSSRRAPLWRRARAGARPPA